MTFTVIRFGRSFAYTLSLNIRKERLANQSLWNLCSNIGATDHTSTRFFSLPKPEIRPEETGPQPDRPRTRSLPRLMDFPELMWPSVVKSVKNWITINFIIRPYFDHEFQIKDFIYGAKRAIQVISSKLVQGDFSSLNNLVTLEAIEELKIVIHKMPLAQRRQLEVHEKDIYLSFPYQVGILFDEEQGKILRRSVEITMVCHVLQGLTDIMERGEGIPWNMGSLPEYQERVCICNYRFIKDFTQGMESDWTVNIVNHFKPIDIVNEK